MKRILFVIAVIGIWLASKIRMSEPPSMWFNPKLSTIEHEHGLLECELYNDGVLIDEFIVENEQQLRDYMKQQYNAHIYFE